MTLYVYQTKIKVEVVLTNNAKKGQNVLLHDIHEMNLINKN